MRNFHPQKTRRFIPAHKEIPYEMHRLTDTKLEILNERTLSIITHQALANQSTPGSGHEPTNTQRRNLHRWSAGRSAFTLRAGDGQGKGKECTQQSFHCSAGRPLSCCSSWPPRSTWMMVRIR